MAANQEELRGKQITWHRRVKEQVFSSEEHITVKRITDKATNMKRSWKEARAMQQRSGWGTEAEKNETSVNEALERKCTFFWQLDGIWGSQPNGTLIGGNKSVTSRPRMPSRIRPKMPEITFEIPPQRSPEVPIPPQIPSEVPTQIPTGIPIQIPTEIPSQIPPEIPSSSSSSESPPPVPSTSKSQGDLPVSLPKRSEKRAIIGEKEAGRTKRHRVEMDVKLEIARMKQETARETARIQADAHIRQMEVFGRMVHDLLGAQGLARRSEKVLGAEKSGKQSEERSAGGIGSDEEVP